MNADLSRDNWKPTDVTSEVQDYGTVNRKGRNLDGIVVKATVKMASAERGQYKDECFLFGAVVDNEFQMARDRRNPNATIPRHLPSELSVTSSRAFGLPIDEAISPPSMSAQRMTHSGFHFPVLQLSLPLRPNGLA